MRISSYLKRIIEMKSESQPPGIFSVCSASPYVLSAALMLAKKHDFPLLIESTCNQVNQYGGYMGLTPEQFVASVHKHAVQHGLTPGSIFLGGDHLGPSVWKNETAESAMTKSAELVRQYIRAGYKKIHLDASMLCMDDAIPLTDETIAHREAQLCEVAVNEMGALGGDISELVFVVGTEVPSPGGASRDREAVEVSSAFETETSIAHTRDAFFKRNLHEAWGQVAAFVVQPGVEFSDSVVHRYDRDHARELSNLIAGMDDLVFEAHSTDYQAGSALRELVEDHFAILKVGPALTFAMREALFALEEIEKELLSQADGPLSDLKVVFDQVMISNPQHWKCYYSSDSQVSAYQRKYSYLDRCRYYWAYPELEGATQLLVRNLSNLEIPTALISQYLPDQLKKVVEGQVRGNSMELILGKITDVLEGYLDACNYPHT